MAGRPSELIASLSTEAPGIRLNIRLAVDEYHPEVGDQISLEQFTWLPYLAVSSGNRRAQRRRPGLSVERPGRRGRRSANVI